MKATLSFKQANELDKAMKQQLVDSGIVSSKAFTMSKKAFAKRMARLAPTPCKHSKVDGRKLGCCICNR